jgi:hypothetical protein
LSYNRIESRAVTGLLTGYNTLYTTRLTNNLLYKCGAEEEASSYVLCECEILATLFRHTYLGSFFLDSEDVRNLILRTVRSFIKETSSYDLDISVRVKMVCERPTYVWTEGARTP